jgi:Flp pilus assembly protein TadG
MTICRSHARRGAAALEFALTVPLLLGLLLAGFHFTRTLVTRIRMGDLAAYAARAAVVAQRSDPASVQGFVNQRMQGNPPGNCTGGVGVTTREEQLFNVNPAMGQVPPKTGKALVVELRCATENKSIVGWVLPSRTLVVTASYPF